MILSKCCHDLDLLFWILGRRVVRLSSFGSLLHFRPDQAPHPEVPERCTDGCPVEDECAYYAPRMYEPDFMQSFAGHFTVDLDRASILQALRTGPFGRCVYRSTNDVVDHQTVNMEFEGGAAVNLIMQGHSHHDSRTMRYDGTLATLEGPVPRGHQGPRPPAGEAGGTDRAARRRRARRGRQRRLGEPRAGDPGPRRRPVEHRRGGVGEPPDGLCRRGIASRRGRGDRHAGLPAGGARTGAGRVSRGEPRRTFSRRERRVRETLP